MILSETLCFSKTFSIYSSATTLLHQQCLCRFPTSRASTWCPCPWLCGSCHHGIWSTECSRHQLSCGIVFPLPRKLFLSECSHWVFPPWISSGACLNHHNGPTLPPTPDRRPSRRHYQQNFDVCWYRLTLILLLWLPWKLLEQLFLRDRLSYLTSQLIPLMASKQARRSLGRAVCFAVNCPKERTVRQTQLEH